MHNYKMEYKLHGREMVSPVRAHSPGEAFARFIKKNPEAVINKLYIEGQYGNGYGKTEYQLPGTKNRPE